MTSELRQTSFSAFVLLLLGLTAGSGLSLSGCTSTQEEPLSYEEPEMAAEDASDIAVQRWQKKNHKHFLDWPVDEARMTRGYLPNRKRPHLGLDLASPKGTPILSAHNGLVIYTGRDFKGFGKMVLIEGANGWATLYAHLDKIQVKEGLRVLQGQRIGTMGRTGRATGVHLHFELRKARGPVDPLLYLPGGTKLASH